MSNRRNDKKKDPASKSRNGKTERGPRSTNPINNPRKTGRPYQPAKKATRPSRPKPISKPDDGLVRLNKFIASSGVCSRREADTLISSGIVTVNGKIVTELGTKVAKTDAVKLGDDGLKMEKLFYVLLNKPKDYITTSKDPNNRRTVMELVRRACRERILPVGRLDRNTTGLLLFTNDGNMAKTLTHPSHSCEKLYHVFLNKPITKTHLNSLIKGVELEDGSMKVDEASFVGNGKDKKQVGVKLHSGRNRIVRRLFEHLGFNVVKLDRVMFAGLTKKDLSRGQWRHLTEMEIRALSKVG